MKEIKFNRMSDKDFWSRPQLGDAGYTFRNEGGEGDFVFTLLESFDADDCKGKKIKVICHNLKNNDTWEEIWNDCQYLQASFKNREYHPYWNDCSWLEEYYNKTA